MKFLPTYASAACPFSRVNFAWLRVSPLMNHFDHVIQTTLAWQTSQFARSRSRRTWPEGVQ